MLSLGLAVACVALLLMRRQLRQLQRSSAQILEEASARASLASEPEAKAPPREEEPAVALAESPARVVEAAAAGATAARGAEGAESVQGLERIFQVLNDAVLQTDAQGKVERMNPAAEKLTGWSLAEARGRSLSTVARLEEPPPSTSLMGGMTQVMSIARRNGDRVPVVHQRSIVTDDRNVTGTVLIMRNVSREQRTLEELHSSRRNFQEVIRKSPYGVAIFRDGQFIYVNPKWASTLGHESPDALVGMHVVDALHASEQGEEAYRFFEGRSGYLDSVAEELRAQIEGGEQSPREFRFMRRDGGVAILEISPMQVIRFDGAPACLVVARDVTDLKKLQSQLLVADRMVSVGTLAAGVAHEINNPLSYVLANLDYLGRMVSEAGEGGLDAEQTTELGEVLSEAQEGADRVRVIVRDLKTFSRSDDDKRYALDVHDVLESAIKMAWTEIRHRAQLVRDYDHGVPSVEANEARLGQVFLNLLINAAQALPEGEAEQHEICLRTRQREDGAVVISVQDNGVGIPAENLSRIFDPFFTSKPVGVGTGLGLSICHSIVVSLGGSIDADSVVGKGSTFTISLPPVEQEEAPSVFASSPSLMALGPHGRILIVDDDPGVARVLERALDAHEVSMVQSGREAIERCQIEDYDLILCDLMMPDLTGMDVYAELKELRPDLSKRMIFITGGAFTPRARQFIDEMTHDLVDKPFDLKALRRLVRERLLEQQRGIT